MLANVPSCASLPTSSRPTALPVESQETQRPSFYNFDVPEGLAQEEALAPNRLLHEMRQDEMKFFMGRLQERPKWLSQKVSRVKGGVSLARKRHTYDMYGKWEFSVGQDFRIAVYMSPFCLHIKLHVIPFEGLSRKSKVQFTQCFARRHCRLLTTKQLKLCTINIEGV